MLFVTVFPIALYTLSLHDALPILPDGRRHLNVRTRRLDILRLPAPQLRNRWGPAAIFANDLLLLDEGDRRRRRRHLGHHRTAQNRAWRPYAGFGSGAKDAALLRCNCRGDWSDGCRCEFLLAHTNQIIVN